MPTFNNRPNKFHKDKDGKAFWESRSVAVEAVVFAIKNNQINILIEKRSAKMMDSPNLWCVPCGYLDYDETGWEAIVRELYEETGFDIEAYKESIVTTNNMRPFGVITNPAQNRQNVVLEYCVVLDFDKSKQEFPSHVAEYKNKEIAEIRWMPFKDIINPEYVWAFNHNERIEESAKWAHIRPIILFRFISNLKKLFHR